MTRVALVVMLLGACTGEISSPSGTGGDDDSASADAGPRSDAAPGSPDATPSPPVVGEPSELAGITAAHNTLRAAHGVGPMVWNEDLEALAGVFIADCVFAHSTQQERSNTAGFAYIGENLYYASFLPTGQQVSDAWAAEEADYDYASNTCSGVCGHYTQQVWADSTNLGCAIKQCPDGYIVSCEYGPGGNYVGQRPY